MKITKTSVTASIVDSKLYRASKHKNTIDKAMESPINKELMVQLAEYLSVPYVVVDDETGNVVDTTNAPEQSPMIPSGPAPATSSESVSGVSDMREELSTEPTTETTSETGTTTEETELGLSKESTGEPIMATTEKPVASAIQSTLISSSIDSIIGLLNADADTNGVVRAATTDSELWIYYDDSISLNNVMEAVIARLNSANYNTLEFDRLARRDNAIVFSCVDASAPVKSIYRK